MYHLKEDIFIYLMEMLYSGYDVLIIVANMY